MSSRHADRRFRLLLVDDNEDNLLLLSATLDDPRYDIVETRSGLEALGEAKRERPDLILLDLCMPGIDGVETCRRLKADPELADVPVLFLSATSIVEDRLAGFAVGGVDFITKPFEPEEVLARVRAHIEIASLTAELSARNLELEREIEAAQAFRRELLASMMAPLQGDGPAVSRLREDIEAIGTGDARVILRGSMQDGAEAVARALHEASSRRWRPFVKARVSAAIPDPGELYGATMPTLSRPPSLLERAALADGGTLYVEGADALSRREREQLLATVEDSATRMIVHAEHHASVTEFGSEPATIELPPLNSRREDIPSIIRWTVANEAPKLGKPIPKLSVAELERMLHYPWPGGIPEIVSVVSRALLLGSPGELELAPELGYEGRNLGRYRLQRRLGKGGMGEVWQARHELLPHPVAVKIITPGLAGSRRAAANERFSREAVAIARLQSPYTVRIFDFGCGEDGELYYAMELLDGLNLHLMVRIDGRQSPARTIHLMRQAACSLAEAHAHGLVHRDIKPPNLIVSQLGSEPDWLKVVDFGIVTVEGGHDHDQGFGTPGFVAPELITNSAGPTAASDIYALGCCAYWCLTGDEPFTGDSTSGLLAAHANEVPSAPSQQVDIPVELDDLILSCLSKLPHLRPSAAEIVELLEQLERRYPWTRRDATRWWSERMGVERVSRAHAMTELSGNDETLLE